MPTALILGAGLAGLTCAYELQLRGWQVTLVDANAEPAQSTSFANAGMLTPSMSDPWNAPGQIAYALKSLGQENASLLLRFGALPSTTSWLLRFASFSHSRHFKRAAEANFNLAMLSLDRIKAWEQQLNLNYAQQYDGTLKLFRNAKALEPVLNIARHLEAQGLRHQLLNPTQLVDKEPVLDPIKATLNAGIWYPQDGSGNAREFCLGLTHALKANGAQFAFQQSFKHWLRHGETVVGFATTQQRFSADCLILAAGCFSPQALRQLGLWLPVAPVKGYSLSLESKRAALLPSRPLIDDALHCAITPLGKQLRVAGTAEIAGYSLAKNAKRLANLRTMLQAMLPQQADALLGGKQTAWAGLRPMSADGMPYLGPVAKTAALGRIYLSTGHGHLGWTHAAGSAAVLADLIEGKPTAIATDALHAKRVLRL